MLKNILNNVKNILKEISRCYSLNESNFYF